MPFGLCNAPATFQRLMQNCLGELNLTYCLIYLCNDLLQRWRRSTWNNLHVVFDHFQEHNLRQKPTKCEFFWHEINYLAHHVPKEGMWPSKENLKVLEEFTPPCTYMEILAFLGLVGHYRWFIKGFTHIVQPLHQHPSREGAYKKSKWVMLMAGAKDAFGTLKKACFKAPVLTFADFWQAISPRNWCK